MARTVIVSATMRASSSGFARTREETSRARQRHSEQISATIVQMEQSVEQALTKLRLATLAKPSLIAEMRGARPGNEAA